MLSEHFYVMHKSFVIQRLGKGHSLFWIHILLTRQASSLQCVPSSMDKQMLCWQIMSHLPWYKYINRYNTWIESWCKFTARLTFYLCNTLLHLLFPSDHFLFTESIATVAGILYCDLTIAPLSRHTDTLLPNSQSLARRAQILVSYSIAGSHIYPLNEGDTWITSHY